MNLLTGDVVRSESPPTKKIRGCYEKLLCSHIHKLVERWYYVESRQWQRKAFKLVMKGLWDIVKGRRRKAAPMAKPKDVMIVKMYAQNIVLPEHTKSVEKWIAGATPKEIELFRNTFSSLHIISKRRQETCYNGNYLNFEEEERIKARPATYRKEDLETAHQQIWELFFTRNPKSPEDKMNFSSQMWLRSRPQQPHPRLSSNGTAVYRNSSAKHETYRSCPPYAHWFEPSETPLQTTTREQYGKKHTQVVTRIDHSVKYVPTNPRLSIRPQTARHVRPPPAAEIKTRPVTPPLQKQQDQLFPTPPPPPPPTTRLRSPSPGGSLFPSSRPQILNVSNRNADGTNRRPRSAASNRSFTIQNLL